MADVIDPNTVAMRRDFVDVTIISFEVLLKHF